MNLHRWLGLWLCAAVLVNAQTARQRPTATESVRIAVVNLETLVRELPEAAEIDRRLTETAQRYRDTLTQLRTELERRLEDYRKREALLTPDARAKEEEALRQLQERYLQYQEEKFGIAGEIARLREELLQPLRTKVQDAIRAVAREENFHVVLDRSSPTVLFADDRYDLTYRVLDRLKRGSP
jgi:outer membrane protein